jgi:DNA segregation ATPase FtsK/SpoIIIE-like protein
MKRAAQNIKPLQRQVANLAASLRAASKKHEAQYAELMLCLQRMENRVLYREARAVIAEHKRASASLLQQHLYIGYARAARLLDQLEADGLIGPSPIRESGVFNGRNTKDITDPPRITNFGPLAPIEDVDLYQQAYKIIAKRRQASAPLLQRHLNIGYARAASLLDELEKRGVIGPGRGAKEREIFIKE